MKLAETLTPRAYIVPQKRLFLLKKRLLHQILSINENTRTWFDILVVQKCQLHCFRFGSARLAMWIVTRSARFNSVRSGSVQLGSSCSVNEPWERQALAGKQTSLPAKLTTNSVTFQTRMSSQQLYARADSRTDTYKFTLHFIRMEQWNH